MDDEQVLDSGVLRARSFWRKEMSLLNYLEAFHLAPDLGSLIRSLRNLLEDEFRPVAIHFSLVDVRKKHLVYYYPEVLRGVPVVIGRDLADWPLPPGDIFASPSQKVRFPTTPYPKRLISCDRRALFWSHPLLATLA